MKLEQLLNEQTQVTPEDKNIDLDLKGRVQILAPETSGAGQCPYWKYVKSKLAGQDVDSAKIPKVFADETAKRFKIPLDPTYSTPMCVKEGKVCSYFDGMSSSKINCNWGVKKAQEVSGEQPAQPATQEPVKNTEKVSIQGEV